MRSVLAWISERSNRAANARNATARFVDIFGRESYFVEIQDHGIPEQRKIIPGLLKLAEEFNAMFWESTPYGWPVVGWPSDIPAISKAQADEFYGIFYSPQNITLILVGDFKPDTLEGLAKKYFERIPRADVAGTPRGDEQRGLLDRAFELARNVAIV